MPPKDFDLAIIGGGVIGVSVAFHCANAGLRVVLIERAALGSGATSQTARVVRAYFPRRLKDSHLAVQSLAEYHSFAALTGHEISLERTDFLVILNRPEDVARLDAELDAQRAIGVEVERISAEKACELNPRLERPGILAAIWSPQGFSCKPEEMVHGYAEGARKRGAQFVTAAVTGVDIEAGQLQTTAGAFSAEGIVCAAGPWSGEVAQMAGIHLPVIPKAAELMKTLPMEVAHKPPFTLHLDSGLRTRWLDGFFLIGLEGVEKSGDHRAVWERLLREELQKRYPGFCDVPLQSAWTGTLDYAPSRTAFIGRGTGAHSRFFYAAGFSGRGVCQAPAVGHIIRDLYLHKQPNFDAAHFSIDRAPGGADTLG